MLEAFGSCRWVRSALQVSPSMKGPRLYSMGDYGFGWLAKVGKQKEYVVTLRIKKADKREELEEIVRKHGQTFNIVHVTAILDRLQEQQMSNVEGLLDFAIDKLRGEEEFFRKVTPDKVRTICNIICYLGRVGKI